MANRTSAGGGAEGGASAAGPAPALQRRPPSLACLQSPRGPGLDLAVNHQGRKEGFEQLCLDGRVLLTELCPPKSMRKPPPSVVMFGDGPLGGVSFSLPWEHTGRRQLSASQKELSPNPDVRTP